MYSPKNLAEPYSQIPTKYLVFGCGFLLANWHWGAIVEGMCESTNVPHYRMKRRTEVSHKTGHKYRLSSCRRNEKTNHCVAGYDLSQIM